LPDGKRRGALELLVRKSFPFKQPAFSAVWAGNDASVYCWDNDSVLEAQAKAQVPRGTNVIPETFLRPPTTDGARLVQTLDGVEAQFWSQGFLRSSRWWPTAPSPIDWQKFLRSVGASSATFDAPMSLENLPFLERPWSESAFSFDDWSSVYQNQRAQLIATTLALCPIMFLGSQVAVLSVAENALATERAELNRASESIRADRNVAYENLDIIEQLLALNEYPPQVQLISNALNMLANAGSPQVVSWSFDRGNLEVVLRSGIDLDPTTYIKLFERDPQFENVSGTFVGQERHLQLRMAVTKVATAQAETT
jgi:hypothetical protein